MKTLHIVNIIASTKIFGDIDIELLSEKIKNCQYEPGLFSGLIYRKKTYTIIMFSTGKISSHGSKSEKQAKEAIVDTLNEIENLGAIIGRKEFDNIRIENVVGVGEIELGKSLEEIIPYFSNAIYKTEQFPGLIYKPHNNSITCLIFNSGKVVIVGSKSEKQAFEIYIELIDKINKINKNDC